MTTLSSAQQVALYQQHSLDSTDWLLICQLANVEDDSQERSHQLTSLSFDQFFGLAVHTFITTPSTSTRQQLAQVLPKFGAKAVLSLFKILFHFSDKALSASASANSSGSIDSQSLISLTRSSLKSMEPIAFIIGLESVLSDEAAKALTPLVIDILVSAIREDDGTLLTLLPRLLSVESWQHIKTNLLHLPTFSSIQASVQAQQRRDSLTQAVMNKNVCVQDTYLDYLSCTLS